MATFLFIQNLFGIGDVIHHMPAVTDARRRRPGDRLAWLVEEAFAPLVRLHPAVDEVVPVAWRRWRKSLYAPATLREIAAACVESAPNPTTRSSTARVLLRTGS